VERILRGALTMNINIRELKEFIAIPTLANDAEANQSGIEFVLRILNSIGFSITLEGNSSFKQPVIVAKYNNHNSTKKVVLYGHYDIEKITSLEKWNTPPFQLVEKGGRYYCRGIADNKGILLTRLLAIKELFEKGHEIPNILWIIQGEEEVGGKTAFEIIPNYFKEFGAKLYLEETGIYRNGNPVIFYLPNTDNKPRFLDGLNEAIYSGEAIFEYRHLNKFSKCPLIHNIPANGYYLGFGPNDSLCKIHKENESLDIKNLEIHKQVFKKFIHWVNITSID
jgi:cysteinylglycine-S-conjugate dipeptidase